MTAYLAFLTADGISDATSKFELHDSIRPTASFVAPSVDPSDATNTEYGNDKFEILGECSTQPYLRWVKIESYSFNVRQADTSAQSELVIFTQPSLTTPKLVHACSTQRNFPYLRLEIELGVTTDKTRISVTMTAAKVIDFRSFTSTATDWSGVTLTNDNIERYLIRFHECEWGHLIDNGSIQDAQRWKT